MRKVDVLTVGVGGYCNHHLLLSIKAVTVSFISERVFCGNSVLYPYIKLTDLISMQPTVGSAAKPQIKSRGVTRPWPCASTQFYLYVFIPLGKQFRPLGIVVICALSSDCIQVYLYTYSKPISALF
jgi:hypothetical protein